jgi:hypothetical protein
MTKTREQLLAEREAIDAQIAAMGVEPVAAIMKMVRDMRDDSEIEAAIRATLSCAPVAAWPSEDELRNWASELNDMYGSYNAALEMARRLRAHMTGEPK